MTDKEYEKLKPKITEAFKNTNFGGISNEEILHDSLLKHACGYSTGSKATAICRELLLISSNTGKLTKRGQKLLWYLSKHTITEKKNLFIKKLDSRFMKLYEENQEIEIPDRYTEDTMNLLIEIINEAEDTF